MTFVEGQRVLVAVEAMDEDDPPKGTPCTVTSPRALEDCLDEPLVGVVFANGITSYYGRDELEAAA